MAPLLSKREELRGIALAKRTPRSSSALQKLIETLKTRAIDAALKDPSVLEELTGQRFRVLDADLREEKSLDGDENQSPRLAEVGIYDYDRNLLIVPIIDLRRGALVRIEQRVGIQPPLSADEEGEARSIVAAEQALRLNRPELKVMSFPARVTFSETHPRYGHRCFVLYFWTDGETPERVAGIIVDLSARNIVSTDASELEG
jgi:hypothetical protein